jgi:ABC-type polysaccharide/polyol phosphate export permease
LAAKLRAVWAYRDLVRHLVLRDLRHKYKGSTLGFAWSLANPLLMAAVYTVAFHYIVRLPIDRFPLFLVSGLLPWMFFAAGVSAATGSIVDNGALVRKVAFPRLVLPLSAVLSQFVQFVLMYVVVVPAVALVEGGLSPAMLGVVPVLALQLVFTCGVGLVLAIADVYARDTRHLVDVGLQIWFWLTPVVYSLALVPGALGSLIAWNPMAGFVGAYRASVLDGTMPGVASLATLAALAGVATLAGLVVFSRHERRLAELL